MLSQRAGKHYEEKYQKQLEYGLSNNARRNPEGFLGSPISSLLLLKPGLKMITE